MWVQFLAGLASGIRMEDDEWTNGLLSHDAVDEGESDEGR